MQRATAKIVAPIPDIAASRPLEAKIILRAGEPGGRAVERTLVLPILPKGGLIGVKKNFVGLVRRRGGEFRRHRRWRGRRPRRAQRRRLVALSDKQ